MKQSQLFSKTRKEAPKDEVSKNAELLIRAGYIYKEMAGVYAMLPLGLRVANKICNIIREEMNRIGGVELSLTALQDKKNWEASNRWDDAVVDNWFKTKLKNGNELGLAFTHEEPLTHIMKDYVRSFRDLPIFAYQFQTKFRNEARAKSGIMRTREFIMKDLYSFCVDEKAHNEFYEKAKEAYMNIYKRAGLGDRTYVTFAAGGTFSKYSHEFQTITDAGEDKIFVNEKANLAINEEVFNDEVLKDLKLDRKDFIEKKAVEVGNIFSLGTKFSNAFELNYQDKDGENKPVIMGSYGIGIGRLMGTLVETLSDDKGIIWPESVAPFKVHLVSIMDKEGLNGKVAQEAEKLYKEFNAKGIEVLYDDRDARAGDKFADSDLIGIPYRVVISEKMLAENAVEVKIRKTGEVKKMSADDFIKEICH